MNPGEDLRKMVTAVGDFADEMRAQGIHVGLGSPARCVVCDVPYPCASARPQGPPCLADDDATGH